MDGYRKFQVVIVQCDRITLEQMQCELQTNVHWFDPLRVKSLSAIHAERTISTQLV